MSGTGSDYERLAANSPSVVYDDLENQQKCFGAEQVLLTQDNHRPKFTRTHLMVALSILTTELCERLTYYSIVANMVLFCTTTLNLTSLEASTVTLVFGGTVFIIPVAGGYIADSYAGKFNTIFASGLVYLIGLFLLPASAADYKSYFGVDDRGAAYDLSVHSRRVYFFIGLVFIALGTGGIKANVGPFGAQQVEELGENAIQSFFNWFYWFINAGALIAYSAVAYIQQNISFTVGFLIPFFSMVIALITFVLTRKYYVTKAPEGSILTDSVGICCATRCKGFDRARKENGGRYDSEMVDGVIAVLRTLPVFLLIIMYWAMYSQMSTTFFLQSERMDVQLGSVKMPAAVLNIFDTIIILLLIPIMDIGVYPCLARFGIRPTHLQRMGFGMVLAAGSVIAAGVLEIYRKQELSTSGGITQELAGDVFNASTISMFAQTPEFLLIGASEVFTSITGLEFAYSQAPEFMQGLVMGLFLMTTGVGNYVSEAILLIVKEATKDDPWFPDEINDGHAEYLFFLLGGLMMLNFVVFVMVAKCYTYRQEKQEIDVTETLPVADNIQTGYRSYNQNENVKETDI